MSGPTLFPKAQNQPTTKSSSSAKSSTNQPRAIQAYERWLNRHFPSVCKYPLGDHHHELWRWFHEVKTNPNSPPPEVHVWPRGGAKSTTSELGTVYIGCAENPVRRYCLYVSGTQEQADKHVGAIATFFERVGVDRSLNKYGNPKGWRRNQLRCANGFNVEALGLDTAARGIKLDEFRPDLIIFDDIDEIEDNPKATSKKIRAITNTIIPAGSGNVAILGIQNLIIEDGIFAQLVDDRADFLYDRRVPPIVVAVKNLKTERYHDERTGRMAVRVLGGVPTWEGQNLEIVQTQINQRGLAAFLRESQHEVESADGYFFDVSWWDGTKKTGDEYRVVPCVPEDDGSIKRCRAWDLAATQGGGDFTSGNLHAWSSKKSLGYIEDVVRGQWSSDNVRAKMRETALSDLRKYGSIVWVLAQDPGQAGKDQAEQLLRMLSEIKLEHRADDKSIEIRRLIVKVKPITGKKGVRARGFADHVNDGNYFLVEGEWNYAYRQEVRKFREDEEHEFDDQVDASADAHNELIPARKIIAASASRS